MQSACLVCVSFLTPVLYRIQNLWEEFDRSQQYPSVPRNSRAAGCNGSGPQTGSRAPPSLHVWVPPTCPVPTYPTSHHCACRSIKRPGRPQRVVLLARCCLMVLQPVLNRGLIICHTAHKLRENLELETCRTQTLLTTIGDQRGNWTPESGVTSTGTATRLLPGGHRGQCTGRKAVPDPLCPH